MIRQNLHWNLTRWRQYGNKKGSVIEPGPTLALLLTPPPQLANFLSYADDNPSGPNPEKGKERQRRLETNNLPIFVVYLFI